MPGAYLRAVRDGDYKLLRRQGGSAAPPGDVKKWRLRREEFNIEQGPLDPPSSSVKRGAQFVFGAFQNSLLFLGKAFARAIDVEVQHRHR